MQQPPQMIPVMPSFPPTNITTEQIQRKKPLTKRRIPPSIGSLINHRPLRYQAQLQKNMIYLAAIADAQPLSPAVPAQAGYYMRHAQAAAMAQQQGIFPPKMPMQFNNMHQMHDPRQQQQLHQQNQQAMQGQMGMRPRGASGMPSMHYTEGSFGGGSGGPNSAGGPNDGCEGSKQDASDPRVGGDGQGSSAGGHGNGAGMTASELALKDDSTWKHVPVDSRYFPKVAVVLGDV